MGKTLDSFIITIQHYRKTVYDITATSIYTDYIKHQTSNLQYKWTDGWIGCVSFSPVEYRLSSKSNITVVEDDCEESVGENGKKDEERQDRGL